MAKKKVNPITIGGWILIGATTVGAVAFFRFIYDAVQDISTTLFPSLNPNLSVLLISGLMVILLGILLRKKIDFSKIIRLK